MLNYSTGREWVGYLTCFASTYEVHQLPIPPAFCTLFEHFLLSNVTYSGRKKITAGGRKWANDRAWQETQEGRVGFGFGLLVP